MIRPVVIATFAALGAGLAAVPARADCARLGHPAVGYVAPTYHAPAFHAQGYAPYEVIKPYAVPVAIIPSEFYRVAPDLAYARIAEEAAAAAAKKARDDQGDKLIALLSALVAQQQKAPAPGGGDHPPIPPAAAAPEPAKGSAPAADASPARAVQAMANARCANCHGAGTKFDMSDVTKLTREQRLETFRRLVADPQSTDPKMSRRFMPRDEKEPKRPGTPVSGPELNAVWLWVDEK